MNSKSLFLLYFTVPIGLLLRTPSVIASEPTATLDKIKEQSQTYSVESPFILEKTKPSEMKGYSEVQISNETYYFKPRTNSLAQILSGTPAGNLITADETDAIFEFDGNFYKFDTKALPKSSYKIIEGTPTNYNFSVKKADKDGILLDEFYKITFEKSEAEEKKVLFGNSSSVLWKEATSTDVDTVEIKLPHNGTEGDTVQDKRYYKYTYIPVDGRTVSHTRETGLSGDVNVDFVEIIGTNLGGAIYNKSSTIGNITGDFIKNRAKEITSNSAGGAIFNQSKSIIGNITANFIANYTEANGAYAQGGAIFNNSSTIGNINGDFIGNYAFSSSDIQVQS